MSPRPEAHLSPTDSLPESTPILHCKHSELHGQTMDSFVTHTFIQHLVSLVQNQHLDSTCPQTSATNHIYETRLRKNETSRFEERARQSSNPLHFLQATRVQTACAERASLPHLLPTTSCRCPTQSAHQTHAQACRPRRAAHSPASGCPPQRWCPRCRRGTAHSCNLPEPANPGGTQVMSTPTQVSSTPSPTP